MGNPSETCEHKATAGASDGFVYCCKCGKVVGSGPAAVSVDLETAGVDGSMPRKVIDLFTVCGFKLEAIHTYSPERARYVFSTDSQVGELRRLNPHPGLVYTTLTYEDSMERPA